MGGGKNTWTCIMFYQPWTKNGLQFHIFIVLYHYIVYSLIFSLHLNILNDQQYIIQFHISFLDVF